MANSLCALLGHSGLPISPLDEQEDDAGVAEVKVTMPFTLKKQLVTDWENITQEPRRLVRLPRELTAADVMKQYMDSKANSTPQQIARAQELMDGVRIYFDKVRPVARLKALSERGTSEPWSLITHVSSAPAPLSLWIWSGACVFPSPLLARTSY